MLETLWPDMEPGEQENTPHRRKATSNTLSSLAIQYIGAKPPLSGYFHALKNLFKPPTHAIL